MLWKKKIYKGLHNNKLFSIRSSLSTSANNVLYSVPLSSKYFSSTQSSFFKCLILDSFRYINNDDNDNNATIPIKTLFLFPVRILSWWQVDDNNPTTNEIIRERARYSKIIFDPDNPRFRRFIKLIKRFPVASPTILISTELQLLPSLPVHPFLMFSNSPCTVYSYR